jgi:hypothetical protein
MGYLLLGSRRPLPRRSYFASAFEDNNTAATRSTGTSHDRSGEHVIFADTAPGVLAVSDLTSKRTRPSVAGGACEQAEATKRARLSAARWQSRRRERRDPARRQLRSGRRGAAAPTRLTGRLVSWRSGTQRSQVLATTSSASRRAAPLLSWPSRHPRRWPRGSRIGRPAVAPIPARWTVADPSRIRSATAKPAAGAYSARRPPLPQPQSEGEGSSRSPGRCRWSSVSGAISVAASSAARGGKAGGTPLFPTKRVTTRTSSVADGFSYAQP